MTLHSHDFIIVGGGTAGLVLAARLSEDPSQSILVLEAGSDHSEDPRVKAPAFYQALLKTEVDWGFQTEAQEGLNGRIIDLSQGKVLGGSSVINANVFAPPTKAILDAWAALGNDGWDWDAFKSYYAKVYTYPLIPKTLEKKLGIENQTAKDNNTPKGPIQVSFPGDPLHPVREAWAETFKKKGYLMENDPWTTTESIGAFSNLSTIDPILKERNHVAKTYYTPIKDRENLHVLTNTTVEKVILEEVHDSVKAVGVRYRSEADLKTVAARKEVIIAAGALQSPKLLELSGIGNQDLLTEHSIKVIKDLKGVGENLQDHLACDMGFEAVDEVDTLDALARQEPEALGQALRDFANHTGLLTSSGIKTYAYMPVIEHLSANGRERLQKLLQQNRPSKGAPQDQKQSRDLAYYEVVEKSLLNPNEPSSAYLAAIGQNPGPPADRPSQPLPGKYLTLAVILSNPLSHGSVHIRSKDVLEVPVVDPKYFTNPIDVEVYAQHVLYLQSIAKSPPMSNLLKQPPRGYNSRPELTDLDAATRYIKSRAVSMWHPAGTCAMLPEEKGGVVDTKLRVYGVQNLRVVDSSVVPLLPPGNLQSTIYALAEKAADIIKEEYGLKRAD
ncbi:putative GMC oxidoreductase [Biscogniauxia marginata]|nr:putative GMC oxidoreductase [Biscogniauxia marginata]